MRPLLSTIALLAMLLTPALASPAPIAAASGGSLGLTARYEVDATFRWSDRKVSVRTVAQVKNTTGSSVKQVVFNLATLRIGKAKVGSVTVGGKTVKASVKDQTITVPASVAPGGQASVVINYTAVLSSTTGGDRPGFARAGGVMTAYRWIPWLSRATKFKRPNVGETWVTPISPSVRVSITADRQLTFATGGRLASKNGLTQTFTASNVRDFNFSAAPDYKTSSRSVRGTTITFYYRKMSAKAVLDAAVAAFNAYSSKVGSYPFSRLEIAEVMKGGWDIESPALALVAPGASASLTRWAVAHEVAHQWFYAVVGSDQAAEPFADEAVADFLARDHLNQWAKPKCGTAPLDRTVYKYSRKCFPWVVYVQGNLYLKAYRDKVGNAAFYRGLSNYYSANKWKIGGTRKLLNALDKATGITFHHERFPKLYK